MKIRLMKKTDFNSVYGMWKESKLTIDTYANEKKEFEDMISLNPHSCFVAESKEQIIGSAFGTFNGRRAFIYHVAVHPRWQLKGIGKTLLQKIEEKLKQAGLIKVWLMVNTDNLRVKPFYEKCGYEHHMDSILMRKSL